MSTPKSPTDGGRRAGRNVSHPLVRRTTKGPLDSEADPLAESSAPSVAPVASPTASADPRERADTQVHLPDPALLASPAIDLRFLQDRRAYHQVPRDDVPQSFLKSDQQPAIGTPLDELLRGGHFRRAGEVALNDLLHIPAEQTSQILQLLYCRLACLLLIGRLDLAADEAIPLYDYLASHAGDSEELLVVIPWELRVLLVRLQLFAAQDGGRRGIMAIYSLASEVRTHLRTGGQDDSTALWQQRLQELGIRVADAFVEIGELETARRHLDSLRNSDQNEISARQALLCIHTGNISAARTIIDGITDGHIRTVLRALLASLEGKADTGQQVWRDLSKDDAYAHLAIQNEALFLLYTGQIVEARALLESAVETTHINGTMLFNLSTIYELCSDKATQHKLRLADELAEKPPTSLTGGWERSLSELKL